MPLLGRTGRKQSRVVQAVIGVGLGLVIYGLRSTTVFAASMSGISKWLRQ
jgi:hypothetical protein